MLRLRSPVKSKIIKSKKLKHIFEIDSVEKITDINTIFYQIDLFTSLLIVFFFFFFFFFFFRQGREYTSKTLLNFKFYFKEYM